MSWDRTLLLRCIRRRIGAVHHVSRQMGGESDMNLVSALKSLKVTQEDESIWSFLPCLFGLHFVSSSWANTNFDLSIYAHSNNGNCIAQTISQVTRAFNAVSVDGAMLSKADIAVKTKVFAACDSANFNGTHRLISKVFFAFQAILSYTCKLVMRCSATIACHPLSSFFNSWVP